MWEALEQMRAFYAEKRIDILKDAESIPGVSMHYLLKGLIERQRDELYSLGKEAYGLLKSTLEGGQSTVFTRRHEAGVTRVREHQYEDENLCKRILGYNANALYPSTTLREMPCGKEKVVEYCEAAQAAVHLTQKAQRGDLVGICRS